MDSRNEHQSRNYTREDLKRVLAKIDALQNKAFHYFDHQEQHIQYFQSEGKNFDEAAAEWQKMYEGYIAEIEEAEKLRDLIQVRLADRDGQNWHK